jgi:hypothetical protein
VFFALHVYFVLGNQIPLDLKGKCLAESDVQGDASWNVCCAKPPLIGTESVGTFQFRYTCGKFSSGQYESKKAISAQICAQYCADDPKATVAMWKKTGASGMCYLVRSDKYTLASSPTFLLLEKMDKIVSPSTPPVVSPDSKCKGALTLCTTELEAASEKLQSIGAKLDETGRANETCHSKIAKAESEISDCRTKFKIQSDEDKKTIDNLRDQLKATPTEQWHVPHELNNKIIGTKIHDICPQFHEQLFEVTGARNVKHKWRIYCNSVLVGRSWSVGGDHEKYRTGTMEPYTSLYNLDDLREAARAITVGLSWNKKTPATVSYKTWWPLSTGGGRHHLRGFTQTNWTMGPDEHSGNSTVLLRIDSFTYGS